MEREFRKTWAHLDVSFDDFIRTTEPRHKAGVTEIASGICDAGDIYEGVYEGWYCVSCEEFKQEKDLVDGNCPLHPTLKPEWIREKNYFFRLSKYQQPLLDHFAAHPEFMQPDVRRNEILQPDRGRADRHLRAAARGSRGAFRCRSIPSSVVYVWFDALINYASAVGLGGDQDAVREVVAGRPARDRQGHHAVPRGDLAGDADGREAAAAAAGLRPRLHDARTASG